MIENEISEKIIGCSIKVHKSLPNPATRTIEPPSQPSPKGEGVAYFIFN